MKRGEGTRGSNRRQDEKANEGSYRSKGKSKGDEENGIKREKFRILFSALLALLSFPKETQPEVFRRIMLCSFGSCVVHLEQGQYPLTSVPALAYVAHSPQLPWRHQAPSPKCASPAVSAALPHVSSSMFLSFSPAPQLLFLKYI